MTDDFLYWPDTNHPSLDGAADSIRSLLAEGRYAVQVPKMARLRLWEPEPWEPEPWAPGFDVETLEVRRVVGRAPYVGRPFVYLWHVAMGEGNRWVAGPVEIQYH